MKMDGTEITLLHVFRSQLPYFLESPIPLQLSVLNEANAEYQKQAVARLKDLAITKFHGQSVSCEVLESTEEVAKQICDFAAKNKFDLIVMGTQGYTTLGALFIGSVTQRVLLLSNVPVLVVPHGKGKAASK